MRAITLAILASLLSTSLSATADGTGGDAANGWRSATDVAPGTYQGDIGQGADEEDWYRVAHGAGQGVRATISMPAAGYYDLWLRTDQGGIRNIEWLTPSGGDSVTVSILGAGGGAVRVGIVNWWRPIPVNYSITFEVVELPDAAVLDVRVENVPLRTDHGEIATGTQRDVLIDVKNVGASAGRVTALAFAVTPTDGRSTLIGSDVLDLAPGEETTITLPWDATGIVGDVDVVAIAYADVDANDANGMMRVRHYAIVGGTGQGVTLPPGAGTGTCVPAYVLVTCVGAGTAGGAYAYASHSNLVTSGLVFAGTDGHYADAIAFVGVPYAGAFASASRDVPHGGTHLAACGFTLLVSRCESHWLP